MTTQIIHPFIHYILTDGLLRATHCSALTYGHSKKSKFLSPLMPTVEEAVNKQITEYIQNMDAGSATGYIKWGEGDGVLSRRLEMASLMTSGQRQKVCDSEPPSIRE